MSKKPTENDLTWAATARCPCGAGLAYGKDQQDKESPLAYPYNGYWDCSAIILGTAVPGEAKHTAQLPFAYYDIKSDNQPSANGRTTRPS